MQETPGVLLKGYAIAQLQRAIDCLGWRGSRAHAGVHQARKSMRRVRACLALGESALGAGAKMIDRELAGICESLSSLRDAQARVESLDRLLESNPDMDIRACLASAKRLALLDRADAMREEQAGDANFKMRRERLQVLLAAMPILPWEQIDLAVLASASTHSMQGVEAAAERALSRGKESDWHRLRRRCRRLSQQRTAIGQATIEVPGLGNHDDKLGGKLGEVQDLSVLLAFYKKHPGLPEDKSRLLRRFLKREFRHLSAEAMAGR